MNGEKKTAPQERRADGLKAIIVDHAKHMCLGVDVGVMEVTPYYADNEIFLRELRFSVPASQWSEFEKSQLFRELLDYVQFLAQQTPETHSCNRAPRRQLENRQCAENSTDRDARGSLSESIRRVCQRLVRSK